MVIPVQGDIWWSETEEGRRPVLIVTRSQAIPALHSILVAPVTRTMRGIPTEIPLDPDDGLRAPCAASFDNLQLVPKSILTTWLGSISSRRYEICSALEALADC